VSTSADKGDKEVSMRVLTKEEVLDVGGGNFLYDAVQNARLGGEIGAIVGFVVTDTAAGAARGGLAGAAIAFSWSIGFSIGTQLYESLCR
jgi:hypothetical protein